MDPQDPLGPCFHLIIPFVRKAQGDLTQRLHAHLGWLTVGCSRLDATSTSTTLRFPPNGFAVAMRHVAQYQLRVAIGAADQSGCEPYLKRQSHKVQTRNLCDHSMRGNREPFSIERTMRQLK